MSEACQRYAAQGRIMGSSELNALLAGHDITTWMQLKRGRMAGADIDVADFSRRMLPFHPCPAVWTESA